MTATTNTPFISRRLFVVGGRERFNHGREGNTVRCTLCGSYELLMVLPSPFPDLRLYICFRDGTRGIHTRLERCPYSPIGQHYLRAGVVSPTSTHPVPAMIAPIHSSRHWGRLRCWGHVRGDVDVLKAMEAFRTRWRRQEHISAAGNVLEALIVPLRCQGCAWNARDLSEALRTC